MKKAIRYIIIVLIIAGLAIGYSVYKKRQNKPEWRLDNLSTGDIRETVTASGTINPVLLVNVGTEVSGKVAKLYKDYNSTVKTGEILAKLDTENLENQLEQAQTQVQKAQTQMQSTKLDLDNLKALVKSNMAAEYDQQKAQFTYDQAVQSLTSARFSLKTAEKNLQNAIVTSPIDGVIISRNVDEGQTVAASFNAPTLFVIANDLRKMQIAADVDEADIGMISNGLPVEFTVDSYPNDQFYGKVRQVRLNPSSSQNVVSYSVIIDVNNNQLKLLPGMTANVTIIVREKRDILRIPESALRFKPSKELWKLFGLKWDDSIYGRRFGRQGGKEGEQTPASQDKSASATKSATSQTPVKSGSAAPAESLRQRFANATPEQRAAFRERMMQGGGRPDFANLTPEQRAAFRQRFGGRGQQQEQAQPAAPATNGQFAFTAGALKNPQKHYKVWILKDGKPITLDVVTGLSDGSYAEVISGIPADQQVITGVNYKNAKQSSAANTMPFGGGFGPRP